MKRLLSEFRRIWGQFTRFLGDIANSIRRAYQWFSSILFGSSEYGPWIRLFLFLFAFMVILLAFFPLMDLLTRFLIFLIETVIPEVNNSVKVLWELLLRRGPPQPAPPGPPTISLPQPGLVENLRLIFTNQVFFDLAQRSMLGIIPFGFSILFAAFYFQYLHNAPRFWSALVYMMRAVFPLPKPEIKISNGSVVQGIDQMQVQRFGGPANIVLDKCSAAVFERSNGEDYILTAGQKEQIGSFDNLRTAVFLGTGEVEVTTTNHTKDGIRLIARDARFRYRLYGKPGLPTEPISIPQETIEKLVYRHWLGRDWDKPDKRDKGVHDLVKTELQDYISNHELAEFLGGIEGLAQMAAAGYQHLNPFNTFSEYFTRQAGHYITEDQHTALLWLEWAGKGEWLTSLDLNLKEQIATWELWLSDKRRVEGRSMAAVKGEQWREEVNNLFSRIHLEEIAGMMETPEDIACELMVAYREILDTVRHTVPAPDPSLSQQIDTVLQQIDRLIRSCNHRE